MKLTEKQMMKILDERLIDECTPDEKEQVMNFAFGENFMKSKNKGMLTEYEED